MKKIYLLLIICIPFIAGAQSISYSDPPGVGTHFTLAKDSTFTGALPTPGLTQTWDFSALLNLAHDSVR